MIAIPPAIHAQFTQFLMEKPCATVYSKVVEVQFGPRPDCGRLTGKLEVRSATSSLALNFRIADNTGVNRISKHGVREDLLS